VGAKKESTTISLCGNIINFRLFAHRSKSLVSRLASYDRHDLASIVEKLNGRVDSREDDAKERFQSAFVFFFGGVRTVSERNNGGSSLGKRRWMP
jgi:hypothetical protein